jgi:cytochrome c5
MKKLLSIVLTVASFIFTAILFVNPLTAQSALKGGGSKIPEDVMKIADKSCMHCHAEPGSPMALMHLDLSNWDKYSPEKQAGKAKDMCKMVTKDKMPPKIFCKNHPDDVPNEKDLKTICDWAQSLQVDKK